MTATSYCSLAEFKSYASIPASDTSDDTLINTVLTATYGSINRACGRVFSTSTGTRLFDTRDVYCLDVDDISTATGLTISHDNGDNSGTYSVTFAATDYELRPLNGLLEGTPWPYTEIRAVGAQTFPTAYWPSDRAHIQVSATWGWPSVPDDVVQASKILALDLYKAKDAAFGVAGNSTDFGVLRIRENKLLTMLLQPFGGAVSLPI